MSVINNSKTNILCWGEDIENSNNITKRYLSYRIFKRNFEFISECESNIELSNFDYVEITLDQVTDKITLDLFSNVGEEIIIDATGRRAMFFIIIGNILKAEEA